MSLIKDINDDLKADDTAPIHFGACSSCEKRPADILMIGYSVGNENILVCGYCALQLARKLLEDICALNGGRHD